LNIELADEFFGGSIESLFQLRSIFHLFRVARQRLYSFSGSAPRKSWKPNNTRSITSARPKKDRKER
jgi:hypothetical protein